MRDVRMKGFKQRTRVEDALAILKERLRPLHSEYLPIAQAHGRILSEDCRAAIDVPHFQRSAMDGYAVQAADTFGANIYAPLSLRIIGDARPGKAFPSELLPGCALRIATGAPLPAGADAVIMAEHAEEIGDHSNAIVLVQQATAPGKHVGHIGEDISRGSIIASKGRRLRPQDLGVLASVGMGGVHVVARPRIRILITGNELLPPGHIPQGACIVDTNSLVLSALCERDGGIVQSIDYIHDDRNELHHAFIASGEDILLVSGGSSVGPEDHAPHVLAELGELSVHGLAMRPSSPAGFGFIPGKERARVVFLLPGNPVSCMCAYEFFAGPSIRLLGGRSMQWPHPKTRLRAGAKFVSELGRVDFTRVRIENDRVFPIMTSGASILSSATRADGLVIIPSELEGYAEDEPVDVLLFDT